MTMRTTFSQIQSSVCLEPVSLWWENAIAIIFLLTIGFGENVRDVETSCQKCKKVYHFVIGKGLNMLQQKHYTTVQTFLLKKGKIKLSRTSIF